MTSYAHDHGLPLEVAQDLWEHYNPVVFHRGQKPNVVALTLSLNVLTSMHAMNRVRTAQAAFIDAPEIPPAPKRKVIDIVRTGTGGLKTWVKLTGLL